MKKQKTAKQIASVATSFIGKIFNKHKMVEAMINVLIAEKINEALTAQRGMNERAKELMFEKGFNAGIDASVNHLIDSRKENNFDKVIHNLKQLKENHE